MSKESGSMQKLGMFVIIGLVLFTVTIYFIGKQKNLFGSTFHLKSSFKTVSGLKVGNNVRFSGINIGTVDEIELLSDTSVIVSLLIKKEVQKFIKTDATSSIGSDGLMGDKVLTISSGTSTKGEVKDNATIASKNAIEMEDLMQSVKGSIDNVGVITKQLAMFSSKINNGNGALSKLISDEGFSNSLKGTLVNLEKSSNEFAKFTSKMNDGKGALSKLVSDEKFGNKLDSTMTNLQTGTKGLNETIEAAQHNFLLKGFFNKKKKAEAKKKEEAAKNLEEEKQKKKE
ncbi:MAG: MlaD family protein [Chitinophagaceae bacterium]